MESKVAIIILNWNGWKDTIECLESLFRISYSNYTVIVVDNGSEDGSVDKIKEYAKGTIPVNSKFFEYTDSNKPITVIEIGRDEALKGMCNIDMYNTLDVDKRLIVINNEKNYGFTGGNNVGVKFAMTMLNPDYILLLNNDTVVNPEFLTEMVKVALTDTNIGLVQAKILYYDDLTINNAGGIFYDILGVTKHRGIHEKDENQYDNQVDNFFYASGCCVLINRTLLSKLNNECFDEQLFAFYEDVDLSWTARLLGYKVVYCPKSICYHKEGKTAGRVNPQKAYWFNRNRLRILIKNYSLGNLLWILPISIIATFVLAILASVQQNDSAYLYSFTKGFVWNMRNLKNTLEKRKYIQAIRKVPDKCIRNYMKNSLLEISTRLTAKTKK